MSAQLTVLVVGGYGVFGGRLVDLLRDDDRLTLFVAGRSLAKAASFCAARSGSNARLVPKTFDRQRNVSVQLKELKPDICVDASGPFQGYGVGRYDLIQACIAARIDYLDLADGSDFVAGVTEYDARAKAAGVFVLSGVSSFPVLTAAVARRLACGMSSVSSITAGIAPSPYAGVGENVIRAITSYAGQPVVLRRGGERATDYPFTETTSFVIAPPGVIPLNKTLFSLVDVPDLRVLPQLWPEVSTVWMGAGPVPEVLHRALIAMSWLVRWRVMPSVRPMAGLVYRVVNRLRWGDHRGGMFVELEGLAPTGESLKRSWHLLAEGDDGPLIPSMAAQAVVRRALVGRRPASGSRSAANELELEDYDALFSTRRIYTGLREDTPRLRTQGSLYQRILGSAWDVLPPALRRIHSGSVDVAHGRAVVRRGGGLLAGIVAALFRLPQAGDDVPVTVRFEVEDGGERWRRTFDHHLFQSRLREGSNASERLLCERLGPFEFAQALVVEGDRLRLVMRRWTVFGLRLPLWLAPRSNSVEGECDGRYRFSIELSHPLTGLIVKYEGWLLESERAVRSISERAEAIG